VTGVVGDDVQTTAVGKNLRMPALARLIPLRTADLFWQVRTGSVTTSLAARYRDLRLATPSHLHDKFHSVAVAASHQRHSCRCLLKRDARLDGEARGEDACVAARFLDE
jgi:hypothetical protein